MWLQYHFDDFCGRETADRPLTSHTHVTAAMGDPRRSKWCNRSGDAAESTEATSSSCGP
jgi:hypothetical protein